MNTPDTDRPTSSTDPLASAAEKRVAMTGARDTVARFLSRGGFTGSLESTGGAGTSPPSDDEVRRLAGGLAAAARDDPQAFAILGAVREERQIRDHLAGAVAAIHKDGRSARLTEPQRNALEAIVLLTGRPVLFVKNDGFELPTGMWEMLAPYRPEISNAVKSVGRIDVAMEYGMPYLGSGFVVGENLVMTNRHVVADFVARDASDWILDPGCRMVIDFKQEFGSAERVEIPVERVVWVDDREGVDLALLKLGVCTAGGRSTPRPLRLQKDSGYVDDKNTVCVVGYPAADPTRNDPTEMHRIYGGVYEKKRLAPGRIVAVDRDRGQFTHDCSTLGGNSGSCVVDLSTGSVVGLHFEGSYLVANTAILLPALAADPTFASLNWQVGRDG